MIKSKFIFSILILTFIFLAISCNSENTLIIHYHRYDQNYDNWTLWTWLDETKIEIHPSGSDNFGLIFQININDYPDMGNVNMLPKYKNWENKDDPNRAWIRTMPPKAWIIESDGNIYTEKPSTDPSIKRAFLDDDTLITVALTHSIGKKDISILKPHLEYTTDKNVTVKEIKLTGGKQSKVLQILFSDNISINELPLNVNLRGFGTKNIEPRYILDKDHYYTDETQGVLYTPKESTFKVYAPAASEVQLNIYNKSVGGTAQKFNLIQKNNIWSVKINQDLENKYYTYTIKNYGQNKIVNPELIDPYAKAVTKYNGRGIIINDQTPVNDRPNFSFDKAIIYEMHIRDFSISDDSGIKNKGKYLGFTETGTKLFGRNISTGIDHLTELGINTVQLLPIQDFEFDEEKSEYFWGYMPVNYNAPVGWFASKRTDSSPVREFKKLVDALHKRGIKVVMDVVYNHTSEGNPLIHYNFNGFIPNFYYRQHLDGSYSNGSGCGNEMRSEQPMIRKYIVESLKYWVTEYKIDGFRFDLMGLHDMETMHHIVKTLKDIDPNIFIYGEPWTAGDTPIDPTIKGKQKDKGFSVFNDHFRDALKGPWYNTDPGYVQTGKNVKQVKTGIMGSIDDFAKYPYESINYVAVHDGRTFWDQLHASTQDSNFTKDQLIAMNKLAAVILFTSQGVPFIHGGQEMLRTKFDSHNSYNQPDSINQIRWHWKADNHDMFKYYQGLIQIRKQHPILRKTDPGDIKKSLTFLNKLGMALPPKTIAYLLNRGKSEDNWNKVLVLINPNHKKATFQIPKGNWHTVVNNQSAGLKVLSEYNNNKILVEPISAMVLWQ